MDYSKGKIYKIIDESNGDLYIGSTIQELITRFRTHGFFKVYNKQKSNCKISLIEEYPCDNRRELEEREQYWIDRTDCINKTRAFTTKEMEREMARKQSCKYYLENKDKCKKKSSNYYYENKEMERDKRNKYKKKVRQWEVSMGGRKDLDNNSLVKIDPDLFT